MVLRRRYIGVSRNRGKGGRSGGEADIFVFKVGKVSL